MKEYKAPSRLQQEARKHNSRSWQLKGIIHNLKHIMRTLEIHNTEHANALTFSLLNLQELNDLKYNNFKKEYYESNESSKA